MWKHMRTKEHMVLNWPISKDFVVNNIKFNTSLIICRNLGKKKQSKYPLASQELF